MTLRSALLPAFLVAVSVGGCGGRTQVAYVAPRVTPAATVIPAAVMVAPSANVVAAPVDDCRVTLAVSRVQGAPGCTVDERVSGRAAALVYPCAGGEAVAAFGASVFTGEVIDGNVDVSIETSFQFTDGCTWESKQRITGTLGAGALSYSYTEQPAPGQGRCARGCLASATVHTN